MNVANQEVQNQEEQGFEYYNDVPPEIRTHIINQMAPEDRCRFTRTSKVCAIEAKKSGSFIYGLQLFLNISTHVMLLVRFNGHENREFVGYLLVFREENGRKWMEYKKHPQSNEVLWMIDLDSETDITQLATTTFQQYLQFYQNTIKMLGLAGTNNFDFGVGRFNKLEVIGADNHRDFINIKSKMTLPLKTVLRYVNGNNQLPDNPEQLYQVSESFQAPDLRMNYEQFLKFTAKTISVHIGTLTPENVANFVRSWQNGTIRDNFECVCWSLNRSNFNFRQLFRILGLQYNNSERIEFRIQHNSEAGRFAQLGYAREQDFTRILFDVRNQEIQQ